MNVALRASLWALVSLLAVAGCGDNGLHPREHLEVSGFGPDHQEAGSYTLSRPLRLWYATYPAGTRLSFRAATSSVDPAQLADDLARRLEKAEVPVGQSVIYLSDMHRGYEVPLTGIIRYRSRREPGGSVYRTVEGDAAQAITLGGVRYVAGSRIELAGLELPRLEAKKPSFIPPRPTRPYKWRE